MVAEKTFEAVDGDRLVPFGPVAGRFAGVKTNASADRWKWIFFQDRLPGFGKQSLGGQHLYSRDILPNRTCRAARGRFFCIRRSEISPGAGFIAFGGGIGAREI